jgi:predicted phosphate transport protein (TIGR00153 family)
MPRFSLVPQEMAFYDLFKQDIANALKAAEALREMAADYTDIVEKARAIKLIEHDGDTITHEIIKTLNKTFVTPFDREDIYALCTNVDDVVDLIEAVADACVLYQVKSPTEHLQKGVDILVLAVKELQKAFDKLSTFSGLDVHWIEANSLENQADQIYRAAIGELFSNGHDACDILRWKGVYDLLEDANDKCEDIANVIESITIKHA